MRLDRTASLPAASFLQLMWLASPALPVGGFSYSEGLESAIENAGISSESAVADWLLDQLHITQARGDMALIAKATGAWRRADWVHVRELNDWVLHTRETSELRLQAEQMGRSVRMLAVGQACRWAMSCVERALASTGSARTVTGLRCMRPIASSVVVVAVGAVYMPLGDHGDGDGATTGRGCAGGNGGGCMAVIVAVPMVVGMAM